MISGHNPTPLWLKYFSKILCAATFFLLFAGGMVTSTGSGLAVPDWPLSYGMIFPPMVGGVFYEHGHRMVATVVGFLTVCFVVALALKEKRAWVRRVGYLAIGAVVAQGVLGGITVLFFLPTAVSSAHALLGQTFFLLTIILAYSLSDEWFERHAARNTATCFPEKKFFKGVCVLLVLLYVQLFIGAWMRHSEAGLAIYDFPRHAGQWLPTFDQAMLDRINQWRFMNNLPEVHMSQVLWHFAHRCGAVVIASAVWGLTLWGRRICVHNPRVMSSLYWVNMVLLFQVMLGAITIWSAKAPVPTSLHVIGGAALLGTTLLLALRARMS